jgi:hypothetical protein
MGNSQAKKLAAEKHNIKIDEANAYREDRIRDPEKYVIVMKNKSAECSRKLSPWLISYLIATTFGNNAHKED